MSHDSHGSLPARRSDETSRLRVYALAVQPAEAVERLGQSSPVAVTVPRDDGRGRTTGVLTPFAGRRIVMWRTPGGFRLGHANFHQIMGDRYWGPVFVEGSFLPSSPGGGDVPSRLVVRAGHRLVPQRTWWKRASAVLTGGAIASMMISLASGRPPPLDLLASLFFLFAAMTWLLPLAWNLWAHRRDRAELLSAVQHAIGPVVAHRGDAVYR